MTNDGFGLAFFMGHLAFVIGFETLVFFVGLSAALSPVRRRGIE